MSWQLLVAISVITFSFSTILQKILLKDNKSDPVAYSIVFQILVGLLIFVYAVSRGFRIPDFTNLYLNVILLIILYGVANAYIFKALKYSEASEFTVLFATRTLWTILGAIIFLKEKVNINIIIGAVFIFISILLISWKKHKIKINKGQFYSIIAAVFFGLAFVNDAYILRNKIDVPSYLAIGFILPALAMWLVNIKLTVKMKPLFEPKTLVRLFILAVIYSISAITIFIAYQLGKNAAQIAPLNQTSTILTGILGILILKETAGVYKKIIASIIAFIGVVLIK